MRDIKSWVPAWLAFLAAGTFFTFMTPVGEGIDEPAHFAYVQHVAQTRTVPLGRAMATSQEIDVFLRSHPVGRSLVDPNASLLHTHDDHWKRSETDREANDRVVAGLRFSGDYLEPLNAAVPLYESHQPPLYYLVAAPVFLSSSRVLTFVDTFLVTRLWSVFLASLTIPGAFLLARTLFKDVAAAESVLVLIVLFPGFYPGIVRVTNDALAVPLACWAFYFLISYLETERGLFFWGLSALVTAGLWTKAFFIPVLFAAVLVLLVYRKGKAAVFLLLVSVFGLPWYALTFMQTGAVTGLPETVAAKTSIASSVGTIWRVDWGNAMSVLSGSHIWIGNSSLLGVRRWMPQLITSLFIFGVAGLLVRPRQSGLNAMVPLVLGYAIFACALAYYATQVFQQTGTSVIQGWYLTMFK